MKKTIITLLFLMINAVHAATCLSHMVFYVKNVKETLSFYEKVFDLKPRLVVEGETYAELDSGAVTLAFAQEGLANWLFPNGFKAHDPEDVPFACEIAFVTDDVQDLYDKALSFGAKSMSPPKEMPWGQLVSIVRDPEGVLIEISSRMD